MSKHIIAKPAHKTWNIDKSGDTWVLNAPMTVKTASGIGINVAEPFANSTIIVKRDINMLNGTTSAISIAGDNTTVRIAATSEINAQYGVNAGDDCSFARISNAGTINAVIGIIAYTPGGTTTRAVISNRGDIFGSTAGIASDGPNSRIDNTGNLSGTYGLYAIGAGSKVHNSGMIQGGVAVLLGGDETIFTNHAGGTLRASTGITAEGDNDTTMTIVNHGKIFGYDLVIDGSKSRLNIVNTGTMYGDVDLSNDNDVFDTRHGLFTGTISGNDGDDVIKLRSASQHYVEDNNKGTDKVVISASYTLGANIENLLLSGKANIKGTGNDLDNVLTGNIGGNILDGGLGNDTLSGGRGNDTLIGGGGLDTFVFSTKVGADKISDFIFGDDLIDLRAVAGNHSFADFSAMMTESASGVVLNLGHGDVLTVGGATKAMLTADHFLLAMTGTAGDDMLTGDISNDTLNGAAGNDTVTGAAGKDILNGGAGTDKLEGGIGNDKLTGGADADTFYFTDGAGADVITDFTDHQDLIQLALFGISSFSGVAGLMDQAGDDVTITFTMNDVITIKNFLVSDLTADDFLFA